MSYGEVELKRLTFLAMTFAVMYESDQAGLTKFMRDRPNIAEDMRLTLARGGEPRHHQRKGTSGEFPAIRCCW